MTVHRLLHGPAARPPPGRVAAVVAARLLAVTPAAAANAAQRCNAAGTRRRLRALIALGHPAAALAARIGLPPATIWNLARGITASVTPALHRAVAALYDQLWDQPPDEHTTAQRRAAAAARTRAARNGWPAPMGLDDDQIDDPCYRPRTRWRPATSTSRQHDRYGLSGPAGNAPRLLPGQCRSGSTKAAT